MMFKRVDINDNVTLYLGDCLDVLPTLEDDSIDAIITDPPFGIGFKYNQYEDSSEGYGEWLWDIIEIAEGKCTPGAPVFIWQAMKNCRYFSDWFPRDYRIFAACKNFVQFRPTPIQYAFDPVIFWFVGTSDITPIAGQRDFHVGNTARWVAEKSVGHPCPRPLDTVKYIISLTNSNTILDPFMGSGTAGVAAIQLGRRFIGIEIDEKYFDIAYNRISKALDQPPLFGLSPQSYNKQTELSLDYDLT